MALDRPFDDAADDAPAEPHPQRRGPGADATAARAGRAEVRTRAEYYEVLRAADGGSGQPGGDHDPADVGVDGGTRMAERVAGQIVAPVLKRNARGGTPWTPGTVRRPTGSGSARNAPPTFSTVTRPATGAGTGTGRADPARPSFRPAGMTRRSSMPCWTWRAAPTGRRCARSGTAGGWRAEHGRCRDRGGDGQRRRSLDWLAAAGRRGRGEESRGGLMDRRRDRTTRIEPAPTGSPTEYRRGLWSLSS